MSYDFKHLILGGTFDHFHLGHERLISTALKKAEKVTIGITTLQLYQHKVLSQLIQSYETRDQQINKFLSEENALEKTNILPLTNIYGNSLSDELIDGIVVTEDTKPNADKLNQKRLELNLPPLEIIVVPFVKDANGEKITSERIRLGEIDSKGNSYLSFFLQKEKYILPKVLRAELKKPFGEVFQNTQKFKQKSLINPLIISVGDISSLELVKNDYAPAISIIDHKTQRHDLEINSKQYFTDTSFTLENLPGTINKDFAQVFKDSLNQYLENRQPQSIHVEGEEDLLALPAILLAPLGSLVIYGQHDLGMIAVEITSEEKEKIKKLLTQF